MAKTEDAYKATLRAAGDAYKAQLDAYYVRQDKARQDAYEAWKHDYDARQEPPTTD